MPPEHGAPTEQLIDLVHQTLRHRRAPAALEALDRVAPNALAQRRRAQQPDQAAEALLVQALGALRRDDPAAADLLAGRFWERLTVAEMLAQQRPEPQSERRFFQQQKQAVALFAAQLLAMEAEAAHAQAVDALLLNLPLPTYDRLFGVEETAARVHTLLASPEQAPIISLKGVGGIGKTALADAVVRSTVQAGLVLDGLVWISAKQEYITPTGIVSHGTQVRVEEIFDELCAKLGRDDLALLPMAPKIRELAGILRRATYLVIIDNLETVTDFARLIPWLEQLAGPTRFLLTSRETVPALTTVRTVDLRELTRGPALALIEHVAAARQIRALDPEAVYAVTGGNPLAIILVISQMATLPPATVLDGVRRGTLGDLYRFIYWTAWNALSDPARELLFAIQRAGDAADWAWLTLVSNGSEGDQMAALQQLQDLSLVQAQQAENGDRSYALHRLTSTFLRTEVLGWL